MSGIYHHFENLDRRASLRVIPRGDFGHFESLSVRKPPHFEHLSDRKSLHFESFSDRKSPRFESLCDRKSPHFESLSVRKPPHFENLSVRKSPHFESLSVRKSLHFENLSVRKSPGLRLRWAIVCTYASISRLLPLLHPLSFFVPGFPYFYPSINC